jgi:dTDP-4-amino-4,6-dideoxygalactose transaminase
MNRDAWKRYDKGGSWFYEITLPGFKYNMTDIQAAIGLWQLRKLERFQLRRRQIAARYTTAFSGISGLGLPVTRPNIEHAWHLYPLRIHADLFGLTRDEVIGELHARNIGTSVHFIPIHLHPYYRTKYHFQPGDFPVAYANFQRLVSLPLNPSLTDEEVNRIIAAVQDIAVAPAMRRAA